MIVRENVSLSGYTTLKLGGPAAFFVEARSPDEVREAHAFARARGLPLVPLGGGSNVLVPDTGIDAVVLKIADDSVSLEDGDMLVIGAGAFWDTVVDTAVARGLFGIENLAGIPGTAGGAVVQNIGAYGAELSETFAYAECLDGASGEYVRIGRDEAAFGYRTSLFKKNRDLIVIRIALRLSRGGTPNLSYADLARAREEGAPLTTSAEVARTVRTIRARKFPPVQEEGTAGSFFKNPSVSQSAAETLAKRFPGLPQYPQENGTVKVSLAWLLDKGLSLNGHAYGGARLFERQPIVVVTKRNSTAHEVDALAHDVATRVHEAFGIAIEREVETFGAR